MQTITTLEVRESILNNNDELAKGNRESLRGDNIFLVNIMGSPGAGKTTLLKRTIEGLRDEYRIGVIEADVDSAVDAESVAESGAKVIQLHTGGLCHLDAKMAGEGLEKLISEAGEEKPEVIFIENIGNLVCPAEFDIGAALQVMLLSVPEGDDKPLKYPLMFEVSDCLLVSKLDAAEVFDFDLNALKERVGQLNPGMEIIPLSALKGDGTEEWIDYLKARIEEWKAG
ncbi:MAG: hydrogenase nickel incorporation protein HypB [Lachnospiraceae bacterium]|nr:hydrogenase nickel incorporation protein HypB [Lachnospiraceae bacterium]